MIFNVEIHETDSFFAVKASNLHAEDVTALGISTMRGTFITWDR